MAKEIAIGKKAKISEAQQYMLLSVLGASAFLGVAISLGIHFVNQISFNAEVIAEEEKALVAYSKVIKDTGVCKSPQGNIYTDEELKKCDPDSIDATSIPGTLRSNILEGLAASDALNSVPKENSADCLNQDGETYTYKELNKIYNEAKGGAELNVASQLIKRCSALRVIPDALPAFRNEEALLASLNKIFNISNWEPESISPVDETYISPDGEEGEVASTVTANPMSVQLSIEANTGTTRTVLSNIERSIRDFDISQATIEWQDSNTLSLEAQATAYYVNSATIQESTKTIKFDKSARASSGTSTTEASQ